MHAPGSLEDISAVSRFLLKWATELGIPAYEHALFVERLLTLLTSCDERRIEQWEQQSWWEFCGADRRSAAYGRFLADGLTRTLVAARAREMSARTGGLILLQLLFDLTRAGGRADRVLNASTQEAWITPWIDHLQRRGVELHAGAAVAGIEYANGRIAGVTVDRSGGAVERVSAEFYVAALPVEQLAACDAGVAPRRAGPGAARSPGHPVDERDHVLPRSRRAARARACDLHRLRVGAHVDLAGAVLGRAGSRAVRGWTRGGNLFG